MTLLTTDQMAEVLGVHRQTLLTKIKAGMPAIRVGRAFRFDPDRVLAWAAQQANPSVVTFDEIDPSNPEQTSAYAIK